VQTEAQLEELLSGVPGIVFACGSAHAEAPQAWALVELPSLALVTPGWILQSRLRGVEVRLVPCAGTCCSGASDVEALANHLLSLCDPPEGTEGPVLLREPLATADAVARLVPREEGLVIRNDAAPLGVLTLAADGCTLCGACGAACPTHALRLDENERETILRFEPDACVGCGRCAATCPESVLEVVCGIDFTRVGRGAIELVRVRVEMCDACGTRLPPRAMQRRLRELLPELADAPLDRCTACALQIGVTPPAQA
jgi:ferredoxin